MPKELKRRRNERQERPLVTKNENKMKQNDRSEPKKRKKRN